MRILVSGLDDTTVAFLRGNGFSVEQELITNPEELCDWLVDGVFDACVIDLVGSNNIGVYTPRVLRNKGINAPVIGIADGKQLQQWSDFRSTFLENGGDDLLRSPPNPRELAASLRVATRRISGTPIDIVEAGNSKTRLKINLVTKSVQVNEIPIALTKRERSLILCLARHQGQVVTKEAILGSMYTVLDYVPDVKIINVFVCKVRNKLVEVDPAAFYLIEMVWGTGYRIPRKTAEKDVSHDERLSA
jgi:two-component system cell cycle response regulator CtrA